MTNNYSANGTEAAANPAHIKDVTEATQATSVALSVVLVGAASTPIILIMGLAAGLGLGTAFAYALILAAPFTIAVVGLRKALCWISNSLSRT